MPILSVFFGIVIRMYHADHNPAHFHVQYGEHEAIYGIANGRQIAGKLPTRVDKIVREWWKIRKKDLLRAWKQAADLKTPDRIKPLD